MLQHYIGKQVMKQYSFEDFEIFHVESYSKYTKLWAETQHIFSHVKIWVNFGCQVFSWTATMFSQYLENSTRYWHHHHDVKREVNVQHNSIHQE